MCLINFTFTLPILSFFISQIFFPLVIELYTILEGEVDLDGDLLEVVGGNVDHLTQGDRADPLGRRRVVLTIQPKRTLCINVQKYNCTICKQQRDITDPPGHSSVVLTIQPKQCMYCTVVNVQKVHL